MDIIILISVSNKNDNNDNEIKWQRQVILVKTECIAAFTKCDDYYLSKYAFDLMSREKKNMTEKSDPFIAILCFNLFLINFDKAKRVVLKSYENKSLSIIQ